ncbi:hypothetical protein [Streptomyces sp. NPDC054865]
MNPQNARNHKKHKEQQPRATSLGALGSEPVCQLALALQAEGLSVHWNLGAGEERDLERLIQHHGIAALVEVVVRRTRPGDAPKPARYWLRAWTDLDHHPSQSTSATNVVPLDRSTRGGHTAALMGALALLTQDGGA